MRCNLVHYLLILESLAQFSAASEFIHHSAVSRDNLQVTQDKFSGSPLTEAGHGMEKPDEVAKIIPEGFQDPFYAPSGLSAHSHENAEAKHWNAYRQEREQEPPRTPSHSLNILREVQEENNNELTKHGVANEASPLAAIRKFLSETMRDSKETPKLQKYKKGPNENYFGPTKYMNIFESPKHTFEEQFVAKLTQIRENLLCGTKAMSSLERYNAHAHVSVISEEAKTNQLILHLLDRALRDLPIIINLSKFMNSINRQKQNVKTYSDIGKEIESIFRSKINTDPYEQPEGRIIFAMWAAHCMVKENESLGWTTTFDKRVKNLADYLTPEHSEHFLQICEEYIFGKIKANSWFFRSNPMEG